MGFLTKLFAPKPPPPPPPSSIVVESRPWVMVYDVPADPGWERHDTQRTGEGFVVQVLQLARTDDHLVLLAKDYAGAVDETIGELEARDWRGQYAQVFDTLTSVRVARCWQRLMDRTVAAIDVVAEGTTAEGAQRIHERYAFAPGHQLIVTAAGSASAHERFAVDVGRWFAGIAFRPVR
jgi:hypothetical protein